MLRATALLLFFFACAMGASKKVPNLTGNWRLDLVKSDFAKQGPPKAKLTRIQHKDPDLALTIEEELPNGQRSGGTAKYTTDGVEVTNSVAGNAMQSIARWEGQVLYMKTSGSFGTNKILLEDRYELSKDKRTLTIRRHFEGQRGGIQDQVLVNRREK